MVLTMPHDRCSSAAVPLAAAIGCLQPGIDPVFLSLLSQSSTLPLSAHGLIVAGTQAGTALGSLMVWRLGPLLPRRAVILAATIALGCSLVTPLIEGTAALLSIRSCYGLAMGMVYAFCMAAYAAHKPNRAFGAVFLIQLVLSTLVSLMLPEFERASGATGALATLALVPATAVIALLAMPVHDPSRAPRADAADQAAVPREGWALAAATFWFICATMLIWSFCAGLANAAGLDNRTIAGAVAVGSLSGALTAVAVMREKPILPLPVTAVLASGALIAPILLTVPDGDTAFIIALVLLNIGSTAIIVRCSGLAAATSRNSRFRTFVACTHSLGLIAGPLLGSLAIRLPLGLLGGLLLALTMGLGAIFYATRAPSVQGFPPDTKGLEMALD